jgi:hypothetical protein
MSTYPFTFRNLLYLFASAFKSSDNNMYYFSDKNIISSPLISSLLLPSPLVSSPVSSKLLQPVSLFSIGSIASPQDNTRNSVPDNRGYEKAVKLETDVRNDNEKFGIKLSSSIPNNTIIKTTIPSSKKSVSFSDIPEIKIIPAIESEDSEEDSEDDTIVYIKSSDNNNIQKLNYIKFPGNYPI